MARLSELTDRAALASAVAEFKRIGRPAFLEKHAVWGISFQEKATGP